MEKRPRTCSLKGKVRSRKRTTRTWEEKRRNRTTKVSPSKRKRKSLRTRNKEKRRTWTISSRTCSTPNTKTHWWRKGGGWKRRNPKERKSIKTIRTIRKIKKRIGRKKRISKLRRSKKGCLRRGKSQGRGRSTNGRWRGKEKNGES